MEELRAARDLKLRDSDKYHLPDYPLPNFDTSAEIKAYRVELRNLPQRAEIDGIENVELPKDLDF